mmetsp:Transcript_20636/g.53335  ORF Transcript_20636/g.53335 Transcript_20636/m.53335 type:complete len:311 (+) Transcript_20636:20-952(+)
MDLGGAIVGTVNSLVGQTLVVRHLTSARGRELNGQRCVAIGHDPVDMSSPESPRLFCRFEGLEGQPVSKLKLMNLAQPGSFVNKPCASFVPDRQLRVLLERAVAESDKGEPSPREDMKARRDWLESQLRAGPDAIPEPIECKDAMLPASRLAEVPILCMLSKMRFCCVGDTVVDFRRFGEDFFGNGDTCAVCLETVAIGEEAFGLPCSHIFHEDCAREALVHRNVCPTCQAELPRTLETGGPFSRKNMAATVVIRIREWIVSGMCQRCQMGQFEADPLVGLQGPDGVHHLVRQSNLERVQREIFGVGRRT